MKTNQNKKGGSESGGESGGGGGGYNIRANPVVNGSIESQGRVNANGMKGPNLRFFSLIGPYITVGCFLLLSIINMNIKGVIYFIGVVLLIFVSHIVNSFLPSIRRKDGKMDDQSGLALCQAYGFSLLHGSLPFGMLVYSYTFIYLFVPMIQSTIMNYPLLMTLLLLLGTDIMIQLNTKCFKLSTLIMGLVTGILISLSWVFIVASMSPSALYSLSDYSSDKQVCSMPSEQNFKCKVYKNGELISAMTT